MEHPIEIASGQSTTLHQLWDLAATWAMIPGSPESVALVDRSPTDHLGPSYTLTWRLFTEADETTELVQLLYPHADPDPLVYTLAGQQIYGGSTTGGWYRASVSLRELLIILGIPPLETSANVDDAGSCATAGQRSVTTSDAGFAAHRRAATDRIR